MKKTKGFTLIELLVVIAIIGLISSMSLIVLRGKVMAARDAKRRADIATLQSALEVYNFDKQRYPEQTWCAWLPSGHWVCIIDEISNDLPDLDDYIKPNPPSDPGHHKIADWNMYGYIPNPNPNHVYALLFMLEQGPQEDMCNIGPIDIIDDGMNDPIIWSTRCPD